MAISIDVEELRPGEFRVDVIEGASRSTHTVTVDDTYYGKLTSAKITTAELVRRSFEFLLDREPKESILRSFALPVIARYFPEYESEIRDQLKS